MGVEVIHDEERSRFVVELGDGLEAYLSYRERADGTLDYSSTFVPESRRGEGIAEELVVEALGHARDAGRRIVPTCPYVQHVIDDAHPEYAALVAEGGDTS